MKDTIGLLLREAWERKGKPIVSILSSVKSILFQVVQPAAISVQPAVSSCRSNFRMRPSRQSNILFRFECGV